MTAVLTKSYLLFSSSALSTACAYAAFIYIQKLFGGLGDQVLRDDVLSLVDDLGKLAGAFALSAGLLQRIPDCGANLSSHIELGAWSWGSLLPLARTLYFIFWERKRINNPPPPADRDLSHVGKHIPNTFIHVFLNQFKCNFPYLVC